MNKIAVAAKDILKGESEKEGVTEADVDPKELKMGIKIEKEHTPIPALAKKIALDHLAEIPDYYTRLKHMEEMAKKGEAGLKKFAKLKLKFSHPGVFIPPLLFGLYSMHVGLKGLKSVKERRRKRLEAEKKK